jgi:hypothetical protein
MLNAFMMGLFGGGLLIVVPIVTWLEWAALEAEESGRREARRIMAEIEAAALAQATEDRAWAALRAMDRNAAPGATWNADVEGDTILRDVAGRAV